MARFDVWDVIAVPFPHTNRPVRQRRPALVVAIPLSTDTLDLLWVLMVTSAANRSWPGDIPVSDLAVAGLPAASVVRTAKLATIEATDAKPIGQLPLGDRRLVGERLRVMLGAALLQRRSVRP